MLLKMSSKNMIFISYLDLLSGSRINVNLLKLNCHKDVVVVFILRNEHLMPFQGRMSKRIVNASLKTKLLKDFQTEINE